MTELIISAEPNWSAREAVLAGAPAPLHGTLTLPAGDAACDGVLILAGSGPVDRDGNLPGARNDSLKLLAEALAARGVASLRVDKRGIGASRAAGPSERDLRFATYVGDAARWLARLREEERIARTFIIGHSEGALVATMAVHHTAPTGLILIAGAGTTAGSTIRRQLVAAGLPAPLIARADRTLAALARGETVEDPPPRLATLFRPSVQPYLISWLALDPVAELAGVAVPTLVIQGTTDLQVTLDDARLLAGARPGIALAPIEGMNHVLKTAPDGRAANLATYADPTLPLAPQLVPTIHDFLAR